MAEFYRGFVFEYGVSAQLTVEGNRIEVSTPGADREELRELAKHHIDSQLAGLREKIVAEHLGQLEQGREGWNRWRRENPGVLPILAYADLRDKLDNSGGDAYDFSYTNLTEADLRGANLKCANFHQAILAKADLSGACLEGANFCRTDLYETKFCHADLKGANLQGVQLAKTDFKEADLSGCTLYGMSAWDLKVEGATQEDMTIRYVPRESQAEETIDVNDLDLAAFIYLSLNNQNISRVIDGAGRKWVLLLGRFTNGMERLQGLRDELKRMQRIPIIFDFPKPEQRDLLETIILLAGMSSLVIVDINEPRSVPIELQVIAMNFGVPIQPILKEGEEPFGVFSGLRKFPWVFKPFKYVCEDDLYDMVQRLVRRAEEWRKSERALPR